jgi:hypothetical protein
MTKKNKKIPIKDNNTTPSKLSSSFELLKKSYMLLTKQSEEIFPAKEEWRKQLMLRMIEWSKWPDSLHLQGFCILEGEYYHTLRHWIVTYEDMQEPYNHVKRNLAYNRHNGAMTGKCTREVYRDIHKYEEEWLEINKYNDARLKDATQQKQDIKVYLTKPEIITKEEMEEIANEEDVRHV